MCGPRPSTTRCSRPFNPAASLVMMTEAERQLADRVPGMSDGAELAKLVHHRVDRVRLRVAANRHTPAEALVVLAKDESEAVVAHVAKHRNTPVEVLHALATHPEARVRAKVAGNRRTPAATFQQMLDRETEGGVLGELLANKRCTFEMRVPVLLSARGQPFRVRDATDPRFDDATLRQWVADTNRWGRPDIALGEHVMQHRSVSDELVLTTLQQARGEYSLVRVLSSPRVTPALLTRWVKTVEPTHDLLQRLIDCERMNFEGLDHVLSSKRWAPAIAKLDVVTIAEAWRQFAARRCEAQGDGGRVGAMT